MSAYRIPGEVLPDLELPRKRRPWLKRRIGTVTVKEILLLGLWVAFIGASLAWTLATGAWYAALVTVLITWGPWAWESMRQALRRISWRCRR